jgi:predicted ATPase
MTFIHSFSIDTGNRRAFSFNVTAVLYAQDITLSESVTISVGDNGSGKSILLESIATTLTLRGIGGVNEMEESMRGKQRAMRKTERN